MDDMDEVTSEFDRVFIAIWQRRLAFLTVFFVVVTLSYGVLYAVDFIPEPIQPDEAELSAVTDTEDLVVDSDRVIDEADFVISATDERATAGELMDSMVNNENAQPISIIFESLNRTVPVNNPTSRAIADLDEALLTGAVRHPDSADFQNTGNIFILGHSSYLPNVLNRNYQAFNGIQELDWGDIVRLQSADREYVYRVDRVYEAKASEVVVPNSRGEAKLTLSTCNSFGSKDDRFMVEATLIDSYEI